MTVALATVVMGPVAPTSLPDGVTKYLRYMNDVLTIPVSALAWVIELPAGTADGVPVAVSRRDSASLSVCCFELKQPELSKPRKSE